MTKSGGKITENRAKVVKIPLARFLLLVFLATAGISFFALDLGHYFTFDVLRENYVLLIDFVAVQGFVAVFLFVAIYAGSVALSMPGAVMLTISSGLLFGQWYGSLYAVVGATIGAIGIFLVAKTVLGGALRKWAGLPLRKIEAGFQENALNYLLVLRLIPVFPFFVVNIVSAFLGVSLRNYALATFVGIIPGSFVYATFGAGLGSIVERREAFSLKGVLTPEIITALVGLAVLALLPVFYKKFRTL